MELATERAEAVTQASWDGTPCSCKSPCEDKSKLIWKLNIRLFHSKFQLKSDVKLCILLEFIDLCKSVIDINISRVITLELMIF